jgi:hypothetical protein
MPHKADEYISFLFLKHRHEMPHLDAFDVKDFIAKLNTTIPGIRLETARDLRNVRKLFLEKTKRQLSENEHTLLNLCFPANLGPFANQVILDMFPRLKTEDKQTVIPDIAPAEGFSECQSERAVSSFLNAKENPDFGRS